MTQRKIIHIDMDAFYASVEQRDRPEYRGRPIAVGHDGPRGVVATASYEARPYGVRSAISSALAKRLCPNLIFVPARFDVYKEVSRQIRAVFRDYTELVEPLSLDEAFLDVPHLRSATLAAREIKARILAETGLTASAGISVNKLLAKMASDFQKPDRVHTLFPDEIPEKMWPLPVRNLLFLGKASEQKLLNQGIRTIGDLAKEREANVQLWLGEKPGHQLWKYARGIDDSTVKAVPDEAKGFSVETTFNDDITSTEQVLPILLEQCDVLATRMRRKGKKCRCISVTFRTLDFRNRSHQTKLENATDLTDEIYENATRLFAEFWRGQPLRLIGVALTGLTDGSYEQMSLFEDTESKERRRKLDVAMDEIRMKFGNDKITRASIMNSNARIGRKARAQMKNEDRQEE